MFNKKANNLDKILDNCLERILVNGESVEQCLKDYPDYQDELSALLAVSMKTHKAMKSIKARPDFKADLGYRLTAMMNSVNASNQVKTSFRPSFKWQLQWAPAALSLCIVLLLSGGGTVAASSNSMPSDALYNVKLASENVQLFFTFDAAGKANLCSEFVAKRANEIVAMAYANNVEAMNKSSRIMQNQLAMIYDFSEASNLSAFVQEGEQTESGVMTVTVTQTQWIDAADATKNITKTEATEASSDNVVTVTETFTASGGASPTIGIVTTTVPGQFVRNPPVYVINDSNQELIDKLYNSIMNLYAAALNNSGEVLESLLVAITILENSYNIAVGNAN